MKKRTLKALPDLDNSGHPRDALGDFTVLGRPRCTGEKPNGLRCQAIANLKSGRCWAHTPRTTKNQKQAQSAARGRPAKLAKLQRLLPEDLREIFDTIMTSIREVYSGVLPPSRALAISSLAGAAIRIVEASDLDARVRFLEAAQATDLDAYENDYAVDEDAADA